MSVQSMVASTRSPSAGTPKTRALANSIASKASFPMTEAS